MGTKKKKKFRSDNSSNEDRKRPFKLKRTLVDSSDDSSPGNMRNAKPNPNKALDSSESEIERHSGCGKFDHGLDSFNRRSKSKPPIYSDSEAEFEGSDKPPTKFIKSESDNSDMERKGNVDTFLPKGTIKMPLSESESESNDPKSSALAVLAKNQNKHCKDKRESSKP